MISDLHTNYEQIDETMDSGQVNIIATVLGIVIMIIMVIPYFIIWGFGETSLPFIIKVMVGYFLFIVLHELLHLVGYIYVGKASIKDIKLGVLWSQLMPYAHCKIPLKIGDYRISILMPIILAIIPALIGYLYGSGYWMTIGILMATGSLGDLLILWILRKYSGNVYVQDHSTKMGCIVYKRKTDDYL